MTNAPQFVHGPVNAGSHTIKVQAYLNEGQSQFDLRGLALSVLRARV